MYIFKLAKITAIQFLLLIFGAKIQMLFNETFFSGFQTLPSGVQGYSTPISS